MQGDELPFQLFGTQYLINIKHGASWKQLGPESLLKELGPLKFAEIEGLTCEALFKNVSHQNNSIINIPPTYYASSVIYRIAQNSGRGKL